MDVGTGLDSRPCLVLLICHPYIPLHFIEMIFILVPPIFVRQSHGESHALNHEP